MFLDPVEVANLGCKPKLGKIVPQIWLVDWNVVPGSGTCCTCMV